MNFVKNVIRKFSIVGELMRFMWERKLWWLIPMVVMLLLLTLLVVFTESSVVAPFIYALF